MDKYTSSEIFSQFETWTKLENLIDDNKEVHDIISDNNNLDVVFCGAGTSGYIGDSLVPSLNVGLEKPKFYSIYTTEIVSNPEEIFMNKEIILVSFARSGNSPESLEAIKLANTFSKKCINIIITCNEKGALAKAYPKNSIILPKETNDLGFAMTNSFSSMLISAALLFKTRINISKIVNNAKKLHEMFDYSILNEDFENIIMLSDYLKQGFLNEYMLKFVELTAGKYAYYNENYLNFRHGPKSLLNKRTLLFFFSSGDEINERYQYDLLSEINNDSNNVVIQNFGTLSFGGIKNYIVNDVNEIELMLICLPTIQQCSVNLSKINGIDPDNPCPSGEVNRVVKGVNIYERRENAN